MEETPTSDKIEAWKRQLAKQSAAQASKRYRQRHQAQYNEKARLRMAKRRGALSPEAIEKRNEKARAQYRSQRESILDARLDKRNGDYIAEHGWEARYSQNFRRCMPSELLELRERGGPEYEIERLKWKSRVLGARQVSSGRVGDVPLMAHGNEEQW
ncbi:hypothetical protein V5O48_014577 [Marasmius crinis-equi]|uniref:Uncharacterized protein n=1 Tax=Marasmius crinis-equi TaxID=585013 RepID=A0ABR3EWX5_9AGAR